MNTRIGNFNGSSSLSIPVNIKNIYNIFVTKIIIPNRFLYLSNGNFLETISLSGISLLFDEYERVCYGSNSILNKSFCNLIPITPIYVNQNYSISLNLIYVIILYLKRILKIMIYNQ